MSERFYINSNLQPGLVSLGGPEAHHLAVVCRVRPGDQVCLFNGDGREYPAQVLEAGRKCVTLDVLRTETPERELRFRLEVAAPLPRGDRAQFLIEKVTELGAARFVPLQTRRSVSAPREVRLDKLARYVIEASKQCGRNVLMEIGAPVDWESWCRRSDLPAVRRLAHPGGPPPATWTREPRGQAVVVAVGPEGGFTDDEVAAASANGWKVVGLGPCILRVETAALALAAWIIGQPGGEK
jgi:16S rRNA (uracil1498-N3)-methyltransferase